jgi:hypothetical protein
VSPAPRPGQLPETRLSDILDGVAVVIACGLVGFSLMGVQGFPRVLLALGFLAFVPGRAVTVHWPRLAAWSEVAVSMVFSLVILALLAAVTLWARYWHPLGLMQAEAGLSVVGLTMAMIRRHRHQSPAGRGRHAADQVVR